MKRIFAVFVSFVLLSCNSPIDNNSSSDQSGKPENQQPNDKLEKYRDIDDSKEDYNKSSNLNISYTQEQSDEIDSAFGQFNLSDEDMVVLKKIYADPDPDPENKEGLNCGYEIKRCKWCGNEFQVTQGFVTYKSLIEKFTNPITSWAIELGSLFGGFKNTIPPLLHKLCNNFRVGIKYDCADTDDDDYCSERCRWEAKNH